MTATVLKIHANKRHRKPPPLKKLDSVGVPSAQLIDLIVNDIAQRHEKSVNVFKLR